MMKYSSIFFLLYEVGGMMTRSLQSAPRSLKIFRAASKWSDMSANSKRLMSSRPRLRFAFPHGLKRPIVVVGPRARPGEEDGNFDYKHLFNSITPWQSDTMVIRHAKSQANYGFKDIVDAPLATEPWVEENFEAIQSKGQERGDKWYYLETAPGKRDDQPGFLQASVALRRNVNKLAPPDVIIISPMRRTIQSAFAAFHHHIRNGDVKIILDPTLRETSNDGAVLKSNFGTHTDEWGDAFFDPDGSYSEIQIFNHLSKLDNYGFKSKEDMDFWNRVFADQEDIQTPKEWSVPQEFSNQRVAVVSHCATMQHLWNDKFLCNPQNAEINWL